MSRKSYVGAHTALVTPFLPDGSMDWAGFEKNVSFQIGQGIAGLLPVGTTGESPTLTWDEHNRLIDTTIKVNARRRLVMAGTGSNSTDEALRASRHAASFGADALLLIDCYYNGPSSLELRLEYYGAIAAACPTCTVIPYIIPGRTGTAMSPEDLAILAAEHPNCTAVKEATGDVERMAYTRTLVGDGFEILSGDDGITCQIMLDPRIRSEGVISVMSNVTPAAVAKLVQAALDGDAAQARAIDKELTPLFDIITLIVPDERRMPDGSVRVVKDKFRNPLAVKALMNGLGMPSGPFRQPLGKMTRKALEVVRQAARTTWKNSPWILEPIADAYGVDIERRINDDGCWAGLTYD